MGMFEERDVTGVKSYQGPGKNKTVSGTCVEKGYPTVGGTSGSGYGRSSRSVVDGVGTPQPFHYGGMPKQKNVVD